MPTVIRTHHLVHPVTGARINLHVLDSDKEDHGVPDERRNPLRNSCAARCKSNGNARILYCSKACQIADYKYGRPPNQPPHKRTCGKTHVEPAETDESLLPVSRPFDREEMTVYSKTPTTALQGQIEFLSNNNLAHYGFRRPKNGKYVAHSIQGKGGELFLQMRAEAIGRHEMASIAFMEKLLAMSIHPTDFYKPGDYVSQLELEYDVDLDECHQALQASVRHQDLFREWAEWAAPRQRLGVRFGLPWYYFNDGAKFLHPIKYGRILDNKP
ncbi:hypothetical protein R3P38DRAFT_2855084 [Favolaschia claudopus]|uniref:MYND-type domain-containing protein n=1 Tax=Favolaschia claudopus TaxID=2862362 RepID=A0AAW0DNP9_9AGAR